MIESARMIEPDMNSSRLLQSYSSGFSGSPEASKQEDSQSQDVATFAGSSIDFGFDQYTEHSDIDSTFKTVTSEFNKSRLTKEEIDDMYAEAGNPPPPPFNSPEKESSRSFSRQLSAKLSSRALAHARLERSSSCSDGVAQTAATAAPAGSGGGLSLGLGALDVESSPSRNRFAAESPTKRSSSTQSTSTSITKAFTTRGHKASRAARPWSSQFPQVRTAKGLDACISAPSPLCPLCPPVVRGSWQCSVSSVPLW